MMMMSVLSSAACGGAPVGLRVSNATRYFDEVPGEKAAKVQEVLGIYHAFFYVCSWLPFALPSNSNEAKTVLYKTGKVPALWGFFSLL